MTAILFMKWTGLIVATFAVLSGSALAADDAKPACDVPAYLLAAESRLTKVEDAIKVRGKLDVLVIGSRSSSLAAATGTPLNNASPNNPSSVSGPPDAAYPSRLQIFLRDKLPSLPITVTVDVQPKKTSEEMVAELPKIVAAKKPDLVIWQTGTVDAMRAIDPDEFRNAVDEGVAAMKAAGTDVILMNLQYSPRTETMITTAPYIDNMRVVAQQHDVPLFDRFAIMREWSESGDFDLFSPSPGVDLAKRVHECLARALSTFVIDAARVNPAELKPQ
ncbi:MAG: hypothetical protein JWQ82_458 [Tardiphaga sp.]|nr:hypothetical protein [Tardiphaga sp.]